MLNLSDSFQPSQLLKHPLLEPIKGTLTFLYKCPHCNKVFHYNYTDLKSKESVIITRCCFCNKIIHLRTVATSTCQILWNDNVAEKLTKVISILRAQGYTKKDSIRLIDTIEDLSQSVEELVKLVIVNDNKT